MKRLWMTTVVAAAALSMHASRAGAVTEQTFVHVFDGRPFLYVEAEDYSSLSEDADNNGWKIVSKEAPVQSTQGLDILPASSNVSGTALLDDVGGGQHSDKATYQVKFATPGTYQLYTRQTMYDSDGNGSFSNEDSIFISPGFNLNSQSDWVGFQGLQFDEGDPDVEIPNPGFALDPLGFKPDTGDSENEGWLAIRDWRIKSAGVLQGTSSQDPSLQNGVFNWYNRPAFVSSGAGGGFDGDFGFKTEYIVPPSMVGQTVTFEIGTREPYGVFDGFLFIKDDDVNLLDDHTQDAVTTGILTPTDPGVVTVQNSTEVLGGRRYLWVEAENYNALADDADDNGWKVVSKENPVTSTGGLDILPASSNVSGTALLDDIGGGQHSDKAVYKVVFNHAGTYQLYTRQTMYDSNGNGSFSNEDSIFVSPGFNLNSQSDWVGFEGVQFDEGDPDVDIPDPGFALDPAGFKPDTGDSENEGWLAIRDWRIKSEGVLLGTSSQDPSLQNGEFNWYNRPAYVSSGAGGGFDGDFGFKTEFIVTDEMVGQAVTFEIGTREPYGVFDGFLFIEDDNVDLLDLNSQDDVTDAIIPPDTMDIVGGDALLNVQRTDPSQTGAWQSVYGTNAAFPAAGAAQAVPEPAGLALLLGGALGLLGVSARTRHRPGQVR